MSFLIGSLVFVAVYFAATNNEHVGGLLAFVFGLLGKLFFHLEELLEPFKKQKSDAKYPGLRFVLVLVMFVLAVIATSADVYGSLQALQALFGGGIVLPAMPVFFNYAMAALL